MIHHHAHLCEYNQQYTDKVNTLELEQQWWGYLNNLGAITPEIVLIISSQWLDLLICLHRGD